MNLLRMYKQRVRSQSRNVVDARSYRKAAMVDENAALHIMDEYTDAIMVAIRRTLGDEACGTMMKQLA